LTGKIIVAEKYYHGATMDFGRAHIKLREIVGVWTNPANLSAEAFSSKLRNLVKVGNKENIDLHIEEYTEQWPEFVFKTFSKEEIHSDLIALGECYKVKSDILNRNKDILRKELLNQECEFEVYNLLSEKKQALVNENFIRYWLITPLKTSFELIFNSTVHNFQVLTNLPGKFQVIGKGITYIFNVTLYLCLFYFLFSKSVNLQLRLFVFAPVFILFISLTALLFRYVESRYLLVTNPLLFISFSYTVNDAHMYLNKFFKKRNE